MPYGIELLFRDQLAGVIQKWDECLLSRDGGEQKETTPFNAFPNENRQPGTEVETGAATLNGRAVLGTGMRSPVHPRALTV